MHYALTTLLCKILYSTLLHFRKVIYLLGFLLKLLNGTLVNTTAFVNQMASRSGFARIDMSNDDNINMNLLFTHFVVLGNISFPVHDFTLRK